MSKNVFNAFYHPENMLLVVTGNVNPYEVIKICESYYEKVNVPSYQNPKIIYPK